MVQRLGGYGARAAIASGVIMAVGTVVLVLFFALEAPALIASGNSSTWTPLGRGNDALVGLSALVAIPLAALVHQRWRARAPGASGAAFALALAGMVAFGAFGFISFANLIPYLSLFPLGLAGGTGFGLWLLAVNVGGAHPAIRGRLRQLGVATGIGLPLQVPAVIAAGGPSVLSNTQTALTNPIFVVLLGLSVLSFAVGYPIWAIWLGRRLSRSEGTAGATG